MAAKEQTFQIPLSTIVRVIFLALGLYFAFFIREVLIVVFFSLIIASAVNPIARFLERFKIPRVLGVLIIYIGALVLFTSMLITIVVPLAGELRQLASFIPAYTQQLTQGLSDLQGSTVGNGLQEALKGLSDTLSQLTINLFALTGNVFGALSNVAAVLVISFYLSVDEKGIQKFLQAIIPKKWHDYTMDIWVRTQKRLGGWLVTQLLLALIVGVITYIGLSFLGVPNPLVLSMLAGMFEVIPFIGPILAAIPAIILAALKSPLLAILTVLLYVIIQQAESHFLVPRIMQKRVGLNPVIVIIALLIGAKIGGLPGIILSIPITILVTEFTKDSFETKDFKLTKIS